MGISFANIIWRHILELDRAFRPACTPENAPMYLVSRQIDGITLFARALHGCVYWIADPNHATICRRRSTATLIAEGIEGNVVDVSNSAMYVE